MLNLNINDLPIELVMMIFSYFSINDVLSVAGVCRIWYDIAHDKSIWRRLRIGENGTIEVSKFKEIITRHPEIGYINFRRIYRDNGANGKQDRAWGKHVRLFEYNMDTIEYNYLPARDKELMKMVRELKEIRTLINDREPHRSPAISRVMYKNNLTYLDNSNYDSYGSYLAATHYQKYKEYLCLSLETLILDGQRNRDYDNINKLTNLKYLSLFNVRFANSVSFNLPSLTHLIISSVQKHEVEIELNLVNLTHLTMGNIPKLIVDCPKLSTMAFKINKQNNVCPHMVFNWRVNTNFFNESLPLFKSHNIIKIEMINVNLTQHILDYFSLIKLETLIVNPWVSDNIRGIDVFTGLTTLSLNNGYNNGHINHIDIEELNNLNLTTLNITNANIYDFEIAKLTKYIKNIDLTNNRLTGAIIPSTSNICLKGNPLCDCNLVGIVIDKLVISDAPSYKFKDNVINHLVICNDIDKNTIYRLYKDNHINIYNESGRHLPKPDVYDIVDEWLV